MGFQASIDEATSAEEALRLIAHSLPERMNLSRLGLRMQVPASNQVMAVAIWSRGETMLFPGLSHPTTGFLGELFERVLRSGRADRRELGDNPAPIVENLLMGEGHRSAVQLPLISPEGSAVLTILSATHNAFSDEDVAELETLGEELAPRLVRLGKEAMERLASRSIQLPEGPLTEPLEDT